MDIDRISYIFGSLARRRQSHEISFTTKRRSIEPKKIFHEKSKSAPHYMKKSVTPMVSSPRTKSVVSFSGINGINLDETKFKCPMCRKCFVDPRVLPCLHTFCLKCLESLERNDFPTWYDDDSDVPRTSSTSSRKDSSGGSGYVSDKQDDSDGPKGLCCPTCGARAIVPRGGVIAFPPNYTLQHKMVLATLNSRSTHLLCDLCTSDVAASSRCMECAITFCQQCSDKHRLQKPSIPHEILSLNEARDRGITRIRKQILCVLHIEHELTIFCNTCFQVICKECVTSLHRGHVCASISRVARSHLNNLQLAMDRAKNLVEKSALEASKLNATSKRIDLQCSRVQNEIEKFIDDYIKSIDEHKMSLLEQIKQVREEQLQNIAHEKLKLQKKIKDAQDVAYFLDDLLTDSNEVEVMTFVKPVLDKMENCDDNLDQSAKDLKYSDSLQFLPEECVKCPNDVFTLYGVLTTQSVSPENCTINVEDLDLVNLRVGKRVEMILQTKDSTDNPLERGGEYVTAEIRHKEQGFPRSLVVNVHDRRDGTYRINFVPDTAGNFVLTVKVKGEPIKGSPIPLIVRALKPHKGTFHCCTFCSSGGDKSATCGCDGKMPGGYKGCGHGHEGHPGRRHWSCCGNILEHSECVRSTIRSNSQYQFSL